MTTIKIINATTNEEIERPMTADELAIFEQDQINAQKEREAREQIELERENLLKRLGLTEREVRILLS